MRIVNPVNTISISSFFENAYTANNSSNNKQVIPCNPDAITIKFKTRAGVKTPEAILGKNLIHRFNLIEENGFDISIPAPSNGEGSPKVFIGAISSNESTPKPVFGRTRLMGKANSVAELIDSGKEFKVSSMNLIYTELLKIYPQMDRCEKIEITFTTPIDLNGGIPVMTNSPVNAENSSPKIAYRNEIISSFLLEFRFIGETPNDTVTVDQIREESNSVEETVEPTETVESTTPSEEVIQPSTETSNNTWSNIELS